jgi:RNA recognition motif-containing protein
VGNLPFDLTAEQLRDFIQERLQQFNFNESQENYNKVSYEDAVESVRLAFDPVRQQAKGFGHVDLVSDLLAAKALLAMKGQYLGDRELRVDLARRRDR